MKSAMTRTIAEASLLLAVSWFIAARAEAQAVMSFSGTAVANEIDANDDGRTGYTVTFQGRGQFGNSVGGAHIEYYPWDGTSFCDTSSIRLNHSVWSGALTYANGDQLYLELSDGTNCVNFVDGSTVEEINLDITGGNGRFEGATGSMAVSVRGEQLLPDDVPSARTAISAFRGTSTQDIVFPD